MDAPEQNHRNTPGGGADPDSEQHVAEHRFHLVMLGLLVTSLFLDGWLEKGAWDSPRISMITLAIVGVWGFVFAQRLLALRDQRRRVLKDRIERLERRVDQLEREAAQRHVPPLT